MNNEDGRQKYVGNGGKIQEDFPVFWWAAGTIKYGAMLQVLARCSSEEAASGRPVTPLDKYRPSKHA